MINLEDIAINIKSFIKRIKTWVQHSFNKEHIALIKTSINANAYDFHSFLDIQEAYLKYMLQHMEKRLYAVDSVYDQEIKWIKIALSLLAIIKEDVDLFHYTGDIEFETWEDNPKFKKLITDNLVYHCDVNVNMKNLSRYVHDEEKQELYLKYPHEFYELKAKILYFNILANYIETWWD